MTLPNVAVPSLGQAVTSMAMPVAYRTSQVPATTFKPTQPKPLDLSALLEDLTRKGLIGQKPLATSKVRKDKEEADKKKEEEEQREKDELIPFELMFTSENLRKRRSWVIEAQYRGMQCSSCGLRYPPEQTLQYSHHLDWHFRQNKKQQESTKKANTRKFYFSVPDWLQYEEIEDVEERVPSMFETEGIENTMEAEDAEEPSVAVSSDTALGICPACHDTFSQFFHQETEEWRYHNAIQVEGINYHPGCHQDLLRAEEAEKEAKKDKEESEDVEMKDTEEEKKDEEQKEEGKEDSADASTKDKDKEGETTATETEAAGDKEKSTAVNGEEMDTTPAPTETPSTDLQLPIRIKEEPVDVEEETMDGITSTLPYFGGVTIKQEIKEEPADDVFDSEPNTLETGEGMEEEPQTEEGEDRATEDDIEEMEQLWEAPVVSVNAAETDIASSIDGNMELTSPTEAMTTRPAITKIKLNISKPIVSNANNANSNSDAVNNNNNEDDAERKKRDALNCSSIDEEVEEFIPPPFTVDLELKPAFRDVELVEQPMLQQGVEVSGLCSIM